MLNPYLRSFHSNLFNELFVGHVQKGFAIPSIAIFVFFINTSCEIETI